MNKFEVINWSQYMRASEGFPACDTLQEAMSFCKHQTPSNWEAQIFEQYSEVTELDPHGNPVETYYFVTL
jgi:hypothetical protein